MEICVRSQQRGVVTGASGGFPNKQTNKQVK